ncbi:HAF repeat-containing protein [Duganella sp. FT92W]|uniref:HAF repeat-containing protein n=1 Tax=Pseudoduganella rivuli TaxID=2666085 RepID=A0A7X2IQT9_9BURK|nr:HAF repeat-containing protein [Pseudoduganella rivuli]MRV74395.1 HAF repeat-containing protein [Pseudoduganella rivuli]
MRKTSLVATLAAILLTLPLSASAATGRPGFGELPGESSQAYDANRAGQVVGMIEGEDGRRRAVLYEYGKVTELGTLGGSDSEARAINASGMITGAAQNKEGRWRAFIYEVRKGMTDLGSLGGGGSSAVAINASGQVVGHSDLPNGDFHAFVTEDGVMKDLGTLGGKTSYASAVNTAGMVVGTAQNPDGFRRAFLSVPGQPMREVPGLGGRISMASAINDAGLVAGAAETPERRWHAFTWDGKRLVDIGALLPKGVNSFATGINAAGHVAGTVTAEGYQPLTFVYKDGKVSVHPREAGLYLTSKISDSGLVVGSKFTGQRLAAYAVDETAPVQKTSLLDWAIRLGIAAGVALTAWRVRRRTEGPMFPSSQVKIIANRFTR